MTYVSHHLLNRLRVACSIASRSLHEKSRLGAAIFEFFFRSSSDHINPHICTTDRGYVPARRFLCGTTTCFVTKTPSKFLRDRTYRFREITRIVSLKEKDKKDKKEEMKKRKKITRIVSQPERKKEEAKKKKKKMKINNKKVIRFPRHLPDTSMKTPSKFQRNRTCRLREIANCNFG